MLHALNTTFRNQSKLDKAIMSTPPPRLFFNCFWNGFQNFIRETIKGIIKPSYKGLEPPFLKKKGKNPSYKIVRWMGQLSKENPSRMICNDL